MTSTSKSIPNIDSINNIIFSVIIPFIADIFNLPPTLSRLLMLFYVIGVVLGFVFKEPVGVTIDRKFWYFIISIVASFLIIWGIYFLFLTTKIQIDYPKNGSKTDEATLKVSGTAAHLDEQQKLWLIVCHENKECFPQVRVPIKDGKWDGMVFLPTGDTKYCIWAIAADIELDTWLNKSRSVADGSFSPKYFDKADISRNK